MNPSVRTLFHELADLPRAEQERILAERQLPPEVRAEVESLLSFDSDNDRSFTHGVSSAAEAVLSSETASAMAWGSYRRVRAIGSGGMGTVYLAERTDGEIQQQVAVKVLRTDAERPVWRTRFLKERQLLTYLNHPSIVHLIDAGHTDDHQPYLVMEYVDGISIEKYCEKLELREQLRLFLHLCEGVSHAHHHLIIHRDLKPSNILVDATGQPKILDFGIAKLLHETANRTQTVDRLLTPNYASPEQLRGAEETTATDVYSLGAILYKIVSGRSPHESETGTSRAIDVSTGVRPITPARQLNPELPTDVDFILRKALRVEPAERYASVEALANDIRSFLEWRPVQARSADAWYRTRKFVRRYWVPVAAALTLIVGLSVGLVAVNRERAIAERRFEQVRQLSNKVLALDQTLRFVPGSTKARSEIVAMSKDYLEGLSSEAAKDRTLTYEVGAAFLALAMAQGVPTTANLGQYAEAEKSLIKADSLMETVLTRSPNDRNALLKSAEIHQDLMILADSDHRRDDARSNATKAASRLESFLSLGSVAPDNQVLVAQLFNNIALAHKNMHLYPDAIRYGRRALALVNAPALRTYRSNALSIVADSMRLSGDLDGALQTIREAEAIAEDPEHHPPAPDIFNVLWREGLILGETDAISLNRSDEAITVLQKALDTIEAAAQSDSHNAGVRILFISGGRELGAMLCERDPARALKVYDQALSRVREVENNTKARRGEAQLLAASSYPLRRLKRSSEAKERIATALQLLRNTKSYPAESIVPGDELETVLEAQAADFADSGQLQQAAETYQDVLNKIMASHPDPENDLRQAGTLSRLYQELGTLRERTGQASEGQRLAALRLELWKSWEGKLGNSDFIQRQLKAASLQ